MNKMKKIEHIISIKKLLKFEDRFGKSVMEVIRYLLTQKKNVYASHFL